MQKHANTNKHAKGVCKDFKIKNNLGYMQKVFVKISK